MTIQRYADLPPPDPNVARGFQWQGAGPANGMIDFVAISAVVAVNFNYTAGRSYLLVAQGSATQMSTAGASIIRIRAPDADWVSSPGNQSLAVGVTYQWNIVGWFNPTGSGAQLTQVMANAPAGQCRINQNGFKFAIFDMGLASPIY